MVVSDLILQLLIGGLLGIVGQGIRIIVGLKKVYDQTLRESKEFSQLFDSSLIFLSLLIGFVAGILGVVGMLSLDTTKITKETLITLIGIGYAGSDFIEGFVKKYLPLVSSGDGTTPQIQSDTSDIPTVEYASKDNSEQPAIG